MKLSVITMLLFIMSIHFLPTVVVAKESPAESTIYTIYMVRHAEKAANAADKRNPPLSACGLKRAKTLATMFQSINIERVYSSDYLRTQATAQAVAKSKGLNVISYNPRELKSIADSLMQNKQSALVVGHSNTTNVLAGYLSDKSLAQIDEQIYDRVYQVTIVEGASQHAHLQVLHQTFQCN